MAHFGPTILDNFFKPYTKKVWTVDCAKMSVSFLHSFFKIVFSNKSKKNSARSPHWVGTRVAKLPQEKLESLCAMNKDELQVLTY